MKKELLLIMPALFIGGAEKQYRYIMEALSRDFQVTVLLLNIPLIGQEANTDKYIKEHSEISFYQLSGDAINGGAKGGIFEKIEKIKTLVKQYLWIKKYLKEHVVYATMFSYVTQLLLVPVFKSHKVRVVFNERNTGRQICDRKYKIALLKKCDKVISNSKCAAMFIHDKTSIDVEVYNNGIEIKEIEHICHNSFNIVVPARINRIKNQMVVVDALLQLKDMLSTEDYNNIHCTLAGGIQDEEYSLEIKNKIELHNLNISMPGFVSEMNKIYEETDLLILPSFEEGTPNVLLEAYMNGIPALVSDIPMNRDCCITTDILFDQTNPYELATKINLWITDKMVNDKKSYDECNYNFLITNYSMKTLKERYVCLFAHI